MKKLIAGILNGLRLKPAALKLYFLVTNTNRSIRLSIRKRRIPRLAKKRQSGGVLAVDICTEHGLGSKLEWSLEVMAYCEEKGLEPRIRFSYPPAGSDYFGSFFFIRGEKESTKTTPPFTRIRLIPELGFEKDYDKELTIEWAHRLIDKYLGVKQFVLDEVDQFCREHFAQKTVLGIHYRSTDKVGEAPAVAYDSVTRNIRHYLGLYPQTNAIFISTDDQRFREYIAGEFTALPVIIREDYFRSDNSSSIHHNKRLDKFEVNKDALINCLLLSRCHALIKSSSFLSDWSKLFNPALPVVLLNKPYEHALWFPASEIAKDVLYQPI